MGQGYVRNDVSNNIDNGNVINADDLDGEFEALEDAFTATTGHTHDGTTAEGGPVSVVGPVQDLVVSTTSVLPKTTDTLDLGSSGKTFKDAYFSGEVTSVTFVGDLTGDVTGNLAGNVAGNVTGDVTGNADTANAVNNALTVGTGLTLSSGTTYDGSVAVTISTDLDGTYARLASGNNFTVSQTITAGFARLNFTDTNFTTGSNKFSIGAIANGTFGVFALNDGGTLKEELIRFEPAGPSISDSQAAVTLEKGQSLFQLLPSIATSVNTTVFPVGTTVSVFGLTGNEVDRNETRTIYFVNNGSADTGYTIENPSPTPASTLTGTWRSRGVCSNETNGFFYLFQRVS